LTPLPFVAPQSGCAEPEKYLKRGMAFGAEKAFFGMTAGNKQNFRPSSRPGKSLHLAGVLAYISCKDSHLLYAF
jgi:hypothetical protein